MRVDRYAGIYEFSILNDFLVAQGEKRIKHDELPAFGYVAYDGERPIAFAFLRRCEGHLGIFDSLVTDPEACSQIRHAAIEALVDQVMRTAKDLEMTRVMALTRHPTIVERAKSHGFEEQPHRVISLQF